MLLRKFNKKKTQTHIVPNFYFKLHKVTIITKTAILYGAYKRSHYRPGQAQRVLTKLRFPDFMTMAQDGGRLSALRTGRLYPAGNTPGTHFC